MPDSRTFSRVLAGVGLLLGPLLLAVQAVVDPTTSTVDPAVFRPEIAASPDRYALAGVLAPIAAFVFVVGLVGAIRLLRTPRVNLAQVGLGVIVFGMTVFAAFYAVHVIEAVSTRPAFDQPQLQAVFEQAQASPYALLLPIGLLGGLYLGLLVAAVGLFLRRRVVPIWVPAALVVSVVLLLVETSVSTVAGFLLATVGFGWPALRILRTPDEQWERWLVLPELETDDPAPTRSRGAGGRVDARP